MPPHSYYLDPVPPVLRHFVDDLQRIVARSAAAEREARPASPPAAQPSLLPALRPAVETLLHDPGQHGPGQHGAGR